MTTMDPLAEHDIRDEISDDAALRAIRDHHAALGRELAARVDRVLTAVRQRDDPPAEPVADRAAAAARQGLAAFLHGDLLPHAEAEERTLYPAAARDPHAELLVRAMLEEHRALADGVARLDTVTDPITLVALAAELRALFAVHVRKENDYLLPALHDAGTDLASLLHGVHHLITGPHDDHHHDLDHHDNDR
jgi:iron-sulfur cluster repair protein YtfE (RIC family)